MTAVSDLGRQQQNLTLLSKLRTQLSQSQLEVSTGKKTQTFSGLGVRTEASLDYRAAFRRLETFTTTIETAAARADVMDRTMLEVGSIARDVVAQMSTFARSGAPPLGLIADVATRALDLVRQSLNTQMDGRYLFAGTDIATAPYADPSALETNVDLLIADYMAGTSTAAQVLADADLIVDTDLGYAATLAGAGSTLTPIDQGQVVDTTVKADNAGFGQILRGLQLLASLDYDAAAVELDPTLETTFWTIFEGAVARVDGGARQVDGDVADLGIARKTMDDVKVRHESTAGLLNDLIGDIEDVDLAEAISRLQGLQSQLEASYQTIASLREFSLVNFLR